MAHLEKFIQAGTVEDQLREIDGLNTQFDVFRFMKRLMEAYGARAFMVANMPHPTSLNLASHTVITNWPAELITLFDKQGLLATSPLFKKLRSSFVPFQFELEAINTQRGDNVSWQLFSPYRLMRGAYFPVHDSTGMRGTVAFSGDGPSFSLQQMMELSFLSIRVYEKLGQIRSLTTRPADTLTQRELDCLNWTAAGKTSSEIAEILGLSEHTVNHYLNRAAKKLDSVNRTQAVATALRSGLIS
jgi:LuxR family transcriptional regulator, quorum-sensing system regulator BjaR1